MRERVGREDWIVEDDRLHLLLQEKVPERPLAEFHLAETCCKSAGFVNMSQAMVGEGQ